jgi:hypothetical protein
MSPPRLAFLLTACASFIIAPPFARADYPPLVAPPAPAPAPPSTAAPTAPTPATPAEKALIRVEFKTPPDLVVGQRATLLVTLVAPGYFAGSPVFDLPSVPGLVLLPPTSHPVLGTEEIDGVSCTTQLHELSVFARRAGKFEIPPFTVRFASKPEPLAKETVAQELKTPALSSEAKLPVGAEHVGDLLATTSLTMEEKWSPRAPDDKAQTGDAFTRVITFRAADVPGMAFPSFQPGKIPGLAIYPKPPAVHDESDRGDLTGVRVETVSYVCQEAGRVTIPAMRLSWWDTDAKKLRAADLPARHFDIALDPATAHRLAVAQRQARLKAILPWLGAAALALGLTGLAFRFGAGPALRVWAAGFLPVRLAPLNPPPRTSRQ